jgi:hypothetical protein
MQTGLRDDLRVHKILIIFVVGSVVLSAAKQSGIHESASGRYINR